jgi:hypothetical protein
VEDRPVDGHFAAIVTSTQEKSMHLRRPRHGTVAAYLALFVALGGTSFAASTALPSNSVGTSQLKSSAVTGAKVKNGSLTSSDFKKGSLPAGAKGATGATGPAGPAGPTGPAGAGEIAVAAINQSGAVDSVSSGSLSGANIIHNVAGAYCITGLPTTPKNIIATPYSGFNGPIDVSALIGVYGQCPLGTQASVTVISQTTGAAINNGFFLQIS